MNLNNRLKEASAKGLVPKPLADIFIDFFSRYLTEGARGGYSAEALEALAAQYFDLIAEQIAHPYKFDIFHHQIKHPTDYHAFAMNLMRPLVDFSRSKIHGEQHIKAIEATLDKDENVVLLSNHQIEPDPQAINLLLEKSHPALASNMIFVAGHRVITDPVAVPFSKGVNLLCIYSKNYIENPPEHKHEKLMHNRRTMQKMVELLSEGGKCIYVAPSGGRDRPDHRGDIQVSPFDPNSIEMFRLMTLQAARPTHFHTLALATHALQPPPNTVEAKLGEPRQVNFTPIHLAFGPAIDLQAISTAPGLDKAAARKARADAAWTQVNTDYAKLK